jgi:hypothetical protein
MSDINWHVLSTSGTSAKTATTTGDGVYYGMPYVVKTDYKSKKTSITVPGQWTGSADHDGIKMTTDTTSSPGNTVIAFHFTGSAGGTVSAPLTSVSDPSEGCMVEMTCLE